MGSLTVSIEGGASSVGTYKRLDTSGPVEMEDPLNAEHCVEPEREMQDCVAANGALNTMNASVAVLPLECGRAIVIRISGVLICCRTLTLTWLSQISSFSLDAS